MMTSSHTDHYTTEDLQVCSPVVAAGCWKLVLLLALIYDIDGRMTHCILHHPIRNTLHGNAVFSQAALFCGKVTGNRWIQSASDLIRRRQAAKMRTKKPIWGFSR